jgi:hypothetical protein
MAVLGHGVQSFDYQNRVFANLISSSGSVSSIQLGMLANCVVSHFYFESGTILIVWLCFAHQY